MIQIHSYIRFRHILRVGLHVFSLVSMHLEANATAAGRSRAGAGASFRWQRQWLEKAMELVTAETLSGALEGLKPELQALEEAIKESEEPLEGNILYMHQSLELNPKNLAKQMNLFSLASSLPLEDSLVIEVGFNAGHSSLLMLAAHPTLQIVAFDLCEHPYTEPCFQILSAKYPGRLQLVRGRSQQTVPRWVQQGLRADLVHIDGDHEAEAAKSDLRNCRNAARAHAWVVFDDICFSPLRHVWQEAIETQMVKPVELCATNRHGIARYVRPAGKREDLLWELTPTLQHRGCWRHLIVLAPTDHGQDSLLGYLSKHCLWRGSGKQCKLRGRTARHESQWLSLPLRHDLPEDMPCLINLLAPHFSDASEIRDSLPLVDGALLVVDVAEGLTEDFCRSVQAAKKKRHVLFLNKLDKLLALEPSNERCYARLRQILDRLNELLEAEVFKMEKGNVIFGRGSLSVAESIGGWGFHLQELVAKQALHKAWTREQVVKLMSKVWGDHFYEKGRWNAMQGDRGFCKLILQPIREIFSMLETPSDAKLEALRSFGVVPKEGLEGNAWKQSALEAWLPLSQTLLPSLMTLPAPKAPGADAVFYAARCVETLDGQHLAVGRQVPANEVPRHARRVQAQGSPFLMNGPAAVPLLEVSAGALIGLAVDAPLGVAVTV